MRGTPEYQAPWEPPAYPSVRIRSVARRCSRFAPDVTRLHSLIEHPAKARLGSCTSDRSTPLETRIRHSSALPRSKNMVPWSVRSAKVSNVTNDSRRGWALRIVPPAPRGRALPSMRDASPFQLKQRWVSGVSGDNAVGENEMCMPCDPPSNSSRNTTWRQRRPRPDRCVERMRCDFSHTRGPSPYCGTSLPRSFPDKYGNPSGMREKVLKMRPYQAGCNPI